MLLSECVTSWYQPVVIRQAIASWSAMTGWNVSQLFAAKSLVLEFRMGRICSEDIQWEIDCNKFSAISDQFLEWIGCEICDKKLCTESQLQNLGKFANYLPSKNWFAYADYNYISEMNVSDDLTRQLKWEEFGFPANSSKCSTFWLGSTGSYTPCHYDCYGYNLVCQIQGEKKWILFPPSQTDCLYPSRLPFEESSVYSEVNILNPNLHKHPKFAQTTPHVVTLRPGDLLYVPRHWWHFVHSANQSDKEKLTVSINLWVDQPEFDNAERSKEAITKLLTFSLMKSLSAEPEDDAECSQSDESNNPCEAPLWTRLDPSEYINYRSSRSSDDLLEHLNTAMNEHQQSRCTDNTGDQSKRRCIDCIDDTSNQSKRRCIDDTCDQSQRRCIDCIDNTCDQSKRRCIDNTSDQSKRRCIDCIDDISDQSKRQRVDSEFPGYPNAFYVKCHPASEIFDFNSQSHIDRPSHAISKCDLFRACTHPRVVQQIFDVLASQCRN